ncbi:Druantia anti-phage system protein DruA [Candidatus Rariloculus sp.]|uniref:Druantia anti-phage system protein DruA n=1 Tax=Candidatus Rariloculus sp. TaxID=3101265 RepID=UPI003D141A6A
MSEKVINVSLQEASLKRKIRRHLRRVGFRKGDDGKLLISGNGKEVIRALHGYQRKDRLEKNRDFLMNRAPELFGFFASGSDIRPERISPVLEKIYGGTWQAELFRLASLTWSVPVSNGFGRRLRYLVWDNSNRKLIGLIAIGDPVFNLSVRDNLIGWNARDRSARLVNIMDAYVLGAVPPYNRLLAGKMVACLVRTQEIFDDFRHKYGDSSGIISGQRKNARLIAVTTSSSMGRSSVYNRLKLDNVQYFKSIGYTGGWGHFHIPDRLFLELRNYLRRIEHPYADLNRFGAGPNWRLRTTRAALKKLGLKDNLLRHGIRREVFISFLMSEGVKYLRTGKGQPKLSTLSSVDEVSMLALKRWILPRAERRPDYRDWDRKELVSLFGRHGQSIGAKLSEAS